MTGKIHPSTTLFMTVHVGEADRGEFKYDMSTGMSMSPIIRSTLTGKFFTLSWQDVLNLAVAAGIDKEEEES